MLRYAISDGQFAFDPKIAYPASPASVHAKAACHSERSEEPPYFAPPRTRTRHRLLAQAESLAAQQIDFFLLREPSLPAGQLANLARELLAIFTESPTKLLLHSRPDIAVATRSHGVHLPSTPGSLTPNQVRTVFASANLRPPIVTLSCHTHQDVQRACTLQPDLILFGPVFGKTVDNQLVTTPTGLESLRGSCHLAAPVPVLALGGITETNTLACLEAGAAGIAAIRLFS